MLDYPYELINIEKKYELPNNLVDEHNQYVKYKLTDYTKLTDEQRDDMTRLTELLYPYNICASDWNKFQEITANLQKFITINLKNYVNESYFSMDDVDNHIENYINIFKTGDLKTIIYESLKKYGGGDYMGKEMIPMRVILEQDSYTYTNNNGGMLRCYIHQTGDRGSNNITLIVDGNIIINNKYFEYYGVGYYDESIYGDGWVEYIIPFNNTLTITHSNTKSEGEVAQLVIKGMYYINKSI